MVVTNTEYKDKLSFVSCLLYLTVDTASQHNAACEFPSGIASLINNV